MEDQVVIRIQRVSPDLVGEQFSVTKIPEMVYEHLSKLYGIDEEKISECRGNHTRHQELIGKGGQKVFMIHFEETEGDATRTKLALLTWKPNEFYYNDFYEFEIKGKFSSGSWDIRFGNEYSEALTFTTKDELPVAHPLTQYAAWALIEARRIAIDPNAVSQRYIDHAPKPPR